MNREILFKGQGKDKNWIESVETRTIGAGIYKGEIYVLKSDFDRVVEELTKWNKVDEKLPENNDFVLCKVGTTEMGGERIHYTTSSYDKRRERFSCEFDWTHVIEWKYIY